MLTFFVMEQSTKVFGPASVHLLISFHCTHYVVSWTLDILETFSHLRNNQHRNPKAAAKQPSKQFLQHLYLCRFGVTWPKNTASNAAVTPHCGGVFCCVTRRLLLPFSWSFKGRDGDVNHRRGGRRWRIKPKVEKKIPQNLCWVKDRRRNRGKEESNLLYLNWCFLQRWRHAVVSGADLCALHRREHCCRTERWEIRLISED